MMLLQDDYKLDKYYRDQATLIYNNVANFLSDFYDEIIQRNRDYGDPWRNKNFLRISQGSFYLKYDALFATPSGVSFMFAPDNSRINGVKVNGAYAQDSANRPLIFLPILVGNWDLTNIVERFTSTRTVIIHELIHHFDALRKKVDRPTSELVDKEGNVLNIKYFNSSAEFNAYTQEGLDRLDGRLDNELIRKRIFNNMDISFDDFYKQAIEVFRTDFVAFLNKRNRKRFLSRLHAYYREKKEEFHP